MYDHTMLSLDPHLSSNKQIDGESTKTECGRPVGTHSGEALPKLTSKPKSFWAGGDTLKERFNSEL